MKVKVTGTYQVVHGGKVYVDGDTFDVNDADARQWMRRGYVVEYQEPKPRAKPAPKPKMKDDAPEASEDVDGE